MVWRVVEVADASNSELLQAEHHAELVRSLSESKEWRTEIQALEY